MYFVDYDDGNRVIWFKSTMFNQNVQNYKKVFSEGCLHCTLDMSDIDVFDHIILSEMLVFNANAFTTVKTVLEMRLFNKSACFLPLFSASTIQLGKMMVVTL